MTRVLAKKERRFVAKQIGAFLFEEQRDSEAFHEFNSKTVGFDEGNF